MIGLPERSSSTWTPTAMCLTLRSSMPTICCQPRCSTGSSCMTPPPAELLITSPSDPSSTAARPPIMSCEPTRRSWVVGGCSTLSGGLLRWHDQCHAGRPGGTAPLNGARTVHCSGGRGVRTARHQDQASSVRQGDPTRLPLVLYYWAGGQLDLFDGDDVRREWASVRGQVTAEPRLRGELE